MKKILAKYFVCSLGIILLVNELSPYGASAATINNLKLDGYIIKQNDLLNDCWYVQPNDHRRYRLNSSTSTIEALKKSLIPISNKDLQRLSSGLIMPTGRDMDKDGLTDDFESAIGINPRKQDTDGDGKNDRIELIINTDPSSRNKPKLSSALAQRLSGHLLLQVQKGGQLWYVNPGDLKKYYLGSFVKSIPVLEQLAKTVTSSNFTNIKSGSNEMLPPAAIVNYSQMEKKIFDLVNDERIKNSLQILAWNDQIADTARKHSQNQAAENAQLIKTDKLCSYPFIHHEGSISGLYQNDRLNTENIFYFSASAENIALIPKIKEVRYETGIDLKPQNCQKEINELNANYEEQINSAETSSSKISLLKQEISSRTNLLNKEQSIKILGVSYNTESQSETEAVTGWMNSPGHRANILNAEYDEAGMGVAEINGYYIITQVFIKHADCGFQGGKCCEKPGYYPSCFIPLKCSTNLICK
jgi:uncharacterized protein YkwD